MLKKMSSFIMVITLSLGLGTVCYAKEPVDLSSAKVIELNEDAVLEFTKENSETGVGITIVQNIDEDGNVTQNIISEKTEDYINRLNANQRKTTRGYNDGQQELVKVHLSARNWVGTSFSLEFYGHSDEVLKSISGTWYAKNVSALQPDYFNRYMTVPFYSSMNTVTTTLAVVNVGNATRVKLGFSNLTFSNIFGYNGSMAPSFSTVSKP